MIKTIDSVFKKETTLKLFKEINSLNFIKGERDRANDVNTATGEVAVLHKNLFTFKILKKYLSKYKYCNFSKLYRAYVNKFYPNENPYYHTDGKNGYTVLYYVNPEWNLDQQGETQFYLKEQIKGVLPIPGRIVIFSSTLLHRATSFRSMERYTVALKFNK